MVRFALALVPTLLWIGPEQLQQETKQEYFPPVKAKLRLAFGDDCPELQRFIQVELRARGLVLATDMIEILAVDSAKLKLTPFSMAQFGPGKGKAAVKSTVRSEWAVFRLDKAINNFGDISERNIVAIELAGGVQLKLSKP